MTGSVTIKTATGLNEYKFMLSHASSDTFIFTEEQFRYIPYGFKDSREWYDLGSGHKESARINAESSGKTQGTVKKMLHQLVTCQFHNTTFSSPIRNNKSALDNNWFLEEDGRNLSSVLLKLNHNQPAIYQNIRI